MRLAHAFHPVFVSSGTWLPFAVPLIGLPLYAITGQYKGLTRYVGSAASIVSPVATDSCSFACGTWCHSWVAYAVPQQLDALWLLLTGFTGAVRFALRDVLLNLRSTQHKQQLRIAIYGAGEAVPN